MKENYTRECEVDGCGEEARCYCEADEIPVRNHGEICQQSLFASAAAPFDEQRTEHCTKTSTRKLKTYIKNQLKLNMFSCMSTRDA